MASGDDGEAPGDGGEAWGVGEQSWWRELQRQRIGAGVGMKRLPKDRM